jgi:hypothetical protein
MLSPSSAKPEDSVLLATKQNREAVMSLPDKALELDSTFPRDVSIYPKAILLAQTVSNNVFNLAFLAQANEEVVKQYFEKDLSAKGWNIVGKTGQSPPIDRGRVAPPDSDATSSSKSIGVTYAVKNDARSIEIHFLPVNDKETKVIMKLTNG